MTQLLHCCFFIICPQKTPGICVRMGSPGLICVLGARRQQRGWLRKACSSSGCAQGMARRCAQLSRRRGDRADDPCSHQRGQHRGCCPGAVGHRCAVSELPFRCPGVHPAWRCTPPCTSEGTPPWLLDPERSEQMLCGGCATGALKECARNGHIPIPAMHARTRHAC